MIVAPPGSTGATLLLAQASKPEQMACIGNQTGGWVFLFLRTDDSWRDYRRMVSIGIQFVREPRDEPYGTSRTLTETPYSRVLKNSFRHSAESRNPHKRQ